MLPRLPARKCFISVLRESLAPGGRAAIDRYNDGFKQLLYILYSGRDLLRQQLALVASVQATCRCDTSSDSCRAYGALQHVCWLPCGFTLLVACSLSRPRRMHREAQGSVASATHCIADRFSA